MRNRFAIIAALGLLACMSGPLQGQDLAQEYAAERPISGINSVWLEELTWMEVRDAIRDGTTTVIISTGGIEQNGPYLATGKHNYILEQACEGIARKLGNALCAPIVKFVPEGDIDVPSGMMRYSGSISLRDETYAALLTDIATSLATHGFTDVVFIGDSGGNVSGMEAVATALDAGSTGTRFHHISEYYRSYSESFDFIEGEFGVTEPTSDGFHDDIVITSQMMTGDLETVRYRQRLEAGNASINGISIVDIHELRMLGSAILQFRVNETVRAINAATGG
ncbi:MAG: creatininase family protein [Gemmatimonadota bacterium]